jgi:hypothetical protein
MHSIASIRVSDVLRAKNIGEPVNVHVVQMPREPIPDYDAMQELIKSNSDENRRSIKSADDAERREVPEVG